MHTEEGPASQYFSTTLRAPPNLNPLAQSLDASDPNHNGGAFSNIRL